MQRPTRLLSTAGEGGQVATLVPPLLGSEVIQQMTTGDERPTSVASSELFR